MTRVIDNREALCSHGNAAARELLVDVVDEALAALHPTELLAGRVVRRGGTLEIDGTTYDLRAIDDVIVIGAGKGSAAVVAALADVLGDALTRGIVVEKHGQGRSIAGIEVIEAGHPIPDAAGHRAAERVMDLAWGAGERDLVLTCITGGASALLPLPVSGVSLDELADTTRVLLEAGLPIDAVNTVRIHLSRIKGGRLARAIQPAAAASLIVVDEVAGEPWGPTVGTTSTPGDAVAVLARYDLRDRVPPAVVDALEAGGDGPVDPPPDPASLSGTAQRVVLADAAVACEAACAAADARGLDAMLLSTMIEGESRAVGRCLAGIAKEVAEYGRPIEPPCVLVSGGETTVTVTGEGEGGPNQEFALGVALGIDGRSDVTAIAIGTDGTDGPTSLAGGLVDGGTTARARAAGIDPLRELRANNAAHVLRSVDDAVHTGPTWTNVMDLRVLLVGEPPG